MKNAPSEDFDQSALIANAQAALTLHWSYMPDGMFPDVTSEFSHKCITKTCQCKYIEYFTSKN